MEFLKFQNSLSEVVNNILKTIKNMSYKFPASACSYFVLIFLPIFRLNVLIKLFFIKGRSSVYT